MAQSAADPSVATLPRLLRVDPRRIALATQGINFKRRPPEIRDLLLGPDTEVLDGDWDNGAWGTRILEFETLDVYRAFKHRFLDGGRWQDTDFYKRVCREMAGGRAKWRCRTPEEFDARLRDHIEGLYESIKANGFLSQAEMGGRNLADDVRVGIRRDGRFLFFDGRHRLSIARVLGLEEIPIAVVVRHPQWLEFREELVAFAQRALKGAIYQELDHPDLADLRAKHDTQRIGVLKNAIADIDPQGKTLLDIGTHWGYMCQQFEKLGFQCTGIEHSAPSAEFARRLAVATESNYEIWQGNLLDYPAARYDVVLALSIFHHQIKAKDRHEKLAAFLERLDCDVMLFEPHDPVLSARQMEGAYRNYEPDEFVAFVSKHARLPNIEPLGRTADRYKRPIYKLTR